MITGDMTGVLEWAKKSPGEVFSGRQRLA